MLICATIILACTAAIIVFHVSVIPVLLASALLSMMLFTSWHNSEIAPARGPDSTIAEATMKEEDNHD